MKIVLRYPKRQEIELPGRRRVQEMLRHLQINPESVLVIRDNTLLTRDVLLGDEDVVEIRPVISGG